MAATYIVISSNMAYGINAATTWLARGSSKQHGAYQQRCNGIGR